MEAALLECRCGGHLPQSRNRLLSRPNSRDELLTARTLQVVCKHVGGRRRCLERTTV